MRALSLIPIAAAVACTAPIGLDTPATTSSANFVEESCPDQSSNLIAGQNIDAGDVSISNDDTNLYVRITTQDGWLLTETHIFAGTGDIPVNRNGIPVPGRFPYANYFSPGVTTYTEVIPLAGLGVDCDDALKVAVHAVVERTVGDVTEEQTAWGDGEGFGTPRWAFFTLYSGCCEPPPREECLEPVEFWTAADPSTWPMSFDGWVFCYSDATGPLSAEQIMALAPDSFFVQLSQQYLAAFLNSVCYGIDCPVGKALSRTNYLTNDCMIDESEQAEAEALYALFAAYNTGTYNRWDYVCPVQ